MPELEDDERTTNEEPIGPPKVDILPLDYVEIHSEVCPMCGFENLPGSTICIACVSPIQPRFEYVKNQSLSSLFVTRPTSTPDEEDIYSGEGYTPKICPICGEVETPGHTCYIDYP